MPLLSYILLAAQEQTAPAATHSAAPSIDLGGLGRSIVDAVAGEMPRLAQSAAEASVPVIQHTAPTLATSAGTSTVHEANVVITALQASPLNVLTGTPEGLTYANPVVLQLQSVTMTVALVALTLVVVWAGFLVMTRSTLGGFEFGEAVSRIVVGTAMLAATRLGVFWVIWGVNLLSTALMSAHVFGNAIQVLADLQDGGAGLVLTVIVELAALWLYVVMWGRIVILDVLLVFAPLAVVCWVLPQTRGWFSLWVRLFFGWALVGPAVTLVLVLGLAISGSLGRADQSARLAALVLSFAVFVVGAFKVPSMVVSGWGQAISGPTAVAAAGAVAKGGAAAAAPVMAALRAAAHR